MQDHSKPTVSLKPESGGTDRRLAPRFNYLIPAEALLIDEATEQAVSHVQLHVRDVSRSGVRVLSAFPWEPSAMIALSWVCPKGERILKICRIRNHRLGNNNWYTIGLSFEPTPTRLGEYTWAMLVEEATTNAAKRKAA